LENTLEEYNTIYSSVTTWRSRMETQNSNIAASNEGATTETYTEKTTAYNDNELSDFSGHVNVMSCALVEALTKTRGLIARSEDFVNILQGGDAYNSETYENSSSTGDIASYYDNFCSQDGYTGAIKDNTESITDLGIKEEENLTGIEDELKHLKTISVDISGYATHIRDCITKQNYTSPLYDSLKAYCKDVADMHDYVKGIRDAYFPVLDGPREHNRSYNYVGAPTDDKENIYTSRIKELGFSEKDIEVLKRYTGLTAEQLYNQISHMPGAEIANMLNLAYAQCGSADNGNESVVFLDNGYLYGRPSGSDGRIVNTDSDLYNPSKWWAEEKQQDINKWAKVIIGDGNNTYRDENGVLTDDEGRYWIAVGPKVMNPAHENSAECSATEMNYGTKIDVVLEDENGNRQYVYCVVGCCKAHTYPDGIHQTGNAFPNGTDRHPANADDSVVEFVGTAPEWVNDGYQIVEVIVYD
jgi:hypothetical protein